MANTPHKGKTRHIAWLSSFLFKAQCFYRDEDDLAPDDKYYIIGKRIISIETVKLASSQHRFYFDVHKVCGKLGQGKTALGGW